jgi:hypothetical protein
MRQSLPGPARVGVFGWGVVAPKSPNIRAFEKNLLCSESWLSPFNGFGPDNFLVGEPEFRFEEYQPWISQRFAPRHYQNLKEKICRRYSRWARSFRRWSRIPDWNRN